MSFELLVDTAFDSIHLEPSNRVEQVYTLALIRECDRKKPASMFPELSQNWVLTMTVLGRPLFNGPEILFTLWRSAPTLYACDNPYLLDRSSCVSSGYYFDGAQHLGTAYLDQTSHHEIRSVVWKTLRGILNRFHLRVIRVFTPGYQIYLEMTFPGTFIKEEHVRVNDYKLLSLTHVGRCGVHSKDIQYRDQFRRAEVTELMHTYPTFNYDFVDPTLRAIVRRLVINYGEDSRAWVFTAKTRSIFPYVKMFTHKTLRVRYFTRMIGASAMHHMTSAVSTVSTSVLEPNARFVNEFASANILSIEIASDYLAPERKSGVYSPRVLRRNFKVMDGYNPRVPFSMGYVLAIYEEVAKMMYVAASIWLEDHIVMWAMYDHTKLREAITVAYEGNSSDGRLLRDDSVTMSRFQRCLFTFTRRYAPSRRM